MKLEDLQDGMKALVQLSRRDNEEGTAPEWREPQIVTLAVQRREKDYKRGKEFHPAGELLIVGLKDFGWAEYGPDDYDAHFDEWLCEEYRMKILEIL